MSKECSGTEDCCGVNGRERGPSSANKECSGTEDCCGVNGRERGPSSASKEWQEQRIAAESTKVREAHLQHLRDA